MKEVFLQLPVNARRKGKQNERKLANLLAKWTGFEFHTVPASGGLHWKKDQRVSGDVICGIEHSDDFPFSIETKIRKPKVSRKSKISKQMIDIGTVLLDNKNNIIIDAWDQCRGDAESVDRIPLMFLRNNGMSKNEYFVFMEREFGLDVIRGRAYLDHIRFKVGIHRLVIILSSKLFKLDYNRVLEIVKKYL